MSGTSSRRGVLLAMAGALAACRPADPGSSDHPADALPAEAAAVLTWQGGVPSWVERDWLDALPLLAIAPDRGAVALLRGGLDRISAPRDVMESWVAVIEFASDAAARGGLAKLRETHADAPARWRQEGRFVLRDPPTPGVAGRLGEQAWLRAVRLGLGAGAGASSEVFVDLRALRLAEGARAPALGRVPGLDSFLALGARIEAAVAGPRLRAFVRLARTPVGVAKAIDAEAAPLRLPGLLEQARVASFVVERCKPQVFLDALQLATAGAAGGTFGPGPAELVRSLNMGFSLAFRREFWACFSEEWAIAWPEHMRLEATCVLNVLADRQALLEQLAGIESQSGPLRVRRTEAGGIAVFEIDAFGQELVGAVGPQVAVLTRASGRELALAIARSGPGPDWTSPIALAPRELVGAGRLRGPLAFVPEGLPFGLGERLRRQDGAVLWHVSRAGDGLRVDVEVR